MLNARSEQKTHTTEVWAQLFLMSRDCDRVKEFFVRRIGIDEQFLASGLHITVYHARRDLPGLKRILEPANVALFSDETRFMVLVPGGENARPNIEPSRHKVGIRVRRESHARSAIGDFRQRLIEFESDEVLGKRKPSTAKKNAFGAKMFQPHMTILKSGSGVDRDLQKIGEAFRDYFGCLKFDRFAINIRDVRPRLSSELPGKVDAPTNTADLS